MGEVRKIKIMDVKEAEAYVRADCPYCVKNYNFAKEKGWRVVVDMSNRDIIGVEVGGGE